MRRRALTWLLPAAAMLLAACASIGRPEGGLRDMTPPVFVSATPEPGAVDARPKVLTLTFDENLNLNEPATKIVVSPPQTQPPRISANARRIRVEFRDTLLPNTTYTVDFADAIRDLNEGNILDGFAIDFSTGPVRDTLSISGMLFEARNLEPAQGMIVGVYNDTLWTDTTLTTIPMQRITKTNALGRFTIRNLAPGRYRIFAINDLNRDYRWDRSEDIAFYDTILIPDVLPAVVNDTLYNVEGADSVVPRQALRYVPDDVLLTWFNEGYNPRYLMKNDRQDLQRIYLEYSAPADTLPQLLLPDGRDLMRLSTVESSPGLDSITVWLTDTAIMALDTLRLATRYQYTDTLDRMSWRTDTLMYNLRRSQRPKPKKEKAPEDTLPPPLEFMTLTLGGGGSQELNLPFVITSDIPIARLDTAAFRLEKRVDTLWVEAPPLLPRLVDTLQPRRYIATYAWEPKTRYRLTVDSAAVANIYALHNKPETKEFMTKALEDYSTLYVNITGLPDTLPAMVELLRSDEPVAAVPVIGGHATLSYLMPGAYYMRLYTDPNGNRRWDTGNVALARQPEEVYYYPKKIELKKNWEVEQNWDINALPLERQKPEDIKKNKPPKPRFTDDTKPVQLQDQTDDLWDTYTDDPFFN